MRADEAEDIERDEREAELERRDREERTRERDALARDSAGLHWGAVVGLEPGINQDDKYLGFRGRAGVIANYRLGKLDARGSLGLQAFVPFEDTNHNRGDSTRNDFGLDLDLDAVWLIGSRFGLSAGVRTGFALANLPTGCSGQGCAATGAYSYAAAPVLGVKVSPAIFRLGARRNLELALSVALTWLGNAGLLTSGGLQLSYLWY